MRFKSGCFLLVLSVVVGGLLAPLSAHGRFDRGDDDFKIVLLSNSADLISGGDALVEIVLPEFRSAKGLRVEVRAEGSHVDRTSRDVSNRFARRADGRVVGLVDGLALGSNILTAKLPNARRAHVRITNHPKGGPVFSGPQVQPWICMTVENGLGPAIDAQCNAPTKVEYFYRSTNPTTPGFLPYDLASPPTDVQTATTDQGVTVPFVVRRERGTLNRYVYDIAVLADPSQAVSPWQPPTAWNRKLYYLYMGGALPQHIQGQWSDVFHERALSRGFATATSSGDVFARARTRSPPPR